MEFKISSALKNHIGKELITDDNVAILELVKNSYDAGSKNVEIIFENMKSDNPKIYIIDDGKGMSRNDIEKKWLFVGFSEKKDLKLKSNERPLAGEKGIGRFSCDRLGSKLKIITKSREDRIFNVLELNWQDFEHDQNKEFQSIPVRIEGRKSLDKGFNIIKESGTIIEIYQLRDEWDRDKLLKLKRYLQRLINPLQVNVNFQIVLKADDYTVQDNMEQYDYNKVNGLITNKVYETMGLKTTTIDCIISENGDTIQTSLNDKGVFIFEFKEKNNFNLLKNIQVKVSFLNRTAKSTFTRLMGIEPVKYGNVFVFKNGFRVMPLGDPRNDWLGLDIRKGQGFRRTLGTRELLGRVEINGYQENFKEIASREGLMHTPAYNQLIDFIMEKAIKRLEKYVIGAIDWDVGVSEGNPRKDFISIKGDSIKIIEQIAGNLNSKDLKYNKDFLQIVEKKTIEKIPETIKNLEEMIKKERDKDIRDLYTLQVQSLKQGLKLQREETKIKDEEIESKRKENLFLTSILSNDLKNVLNLHHHIKISSNHIKRLVKDLATNVESKELSPDYLRKKIQGISLENDKIHTVATFATKANFQLEGSDMEKDLISFISDYINNVCKEVYRGENNSIINFNISRNTNNPFVTWFKPIEITIILDNLIDNSIKAKAKTIDLVLKESDNDELILLFKDDGRGISQSDKDKIFSYAFTTTNGSGMGLFNIKKIIYGLGGKISFLDNEKAGGAIFEIIFPRQK